MEPLLIPPWLETLLSTTFFSTCQNHPIAPKNECNLYCLDCKEGSFCLNCKSSWHKDHQVIQIRRSSYHDVVRVSEIQKSLDISGVQTYVINSARVLFLNERPQPKISQTSGGKATSHLCEICGRSLLDPCRFCSLGCKLVGIKKDGSASFALSAKKDGEEVGRREGMPRRLPSKEALEAETEGNKGGLCEGMGIKKQGYPSTAKPSYSQPCHYSNNNSRRRKGIPHRAPLGP